MSKTSIISEKPVFSSGLFEVTEAKVSYPTGERKTHHIVRRKPTVVIFPLTDIYELYLIKEYRYLYKKTLLQAVAGFIDGKETSVRAARRELEEETGISAIQWEEFARIEMAASVVKATAHLFLARDFEMGTPKREAGEDIEVVKMPLSDVVEKVMTGEINHSATMIGVLMLDKLRKEKKL